MSFGFGGSPSPFGQQQQQQASPFGGGATPSFGGGAAPNAFGAAAGGAFGGGSQPGAFGAGAGGFGSAGQQRPAFGSASSSPAFGSGGFGGATAQAGGFGTPGAFGASSPATGGFGGSSFGGNTQNPSPFGGGGGAFGSSPGGAQGQQGTRGVPYQVTRETDSLGSGYGGQTGKYVTITAMPAYRQKSVEELRYEDYKQGVKGNAGASPGGSGFGGSGAFGSQSQSGFGASSNSPFGSTAGPSGGFGAPTSGFGSSVSPAGGSSAFGGGGFGATSSPGFGAAQPTSAFGATSQPGFGGGGAFGAMGSASAFGAPQSAAAFGGGAFGAPASGGAFGAMGSAPAFGAPQSAAGFGGGAFGAPASGGAFGAMGSAPAFGAPQSAAAFGGGAFGAASAASTPGFGLGAASTPSFGGFGVGASAPASAPAFGGFSSASAGLGATTGMFGAATAGAATFGTSFSSQPALGAGMSAPGFGAASGGMFGAPAASGGMFGATSTSTFGAFGAAPAASSPSTGIFGNIGGASKPFMSSAAFASQPTLGLSPTPALGASTPSFSFAGAGGFQSSASLFSSASTLGGMAQTPGLSNPTTPTMFGAAGTPTPGGTISNAGTPYGQLPQLPAPKTTTTPQPQATGEAPKKSAGGIASATRSAHTMLSPRLITPRSAMRMRPRRSPGASGTPISGGLTSPQQKMVGRMESPRPSTPIEDSVIVARENPRKLFVRDPVVSPFSAKSLTMPESMKSPLAIPSSSRSAQGKTTSQDNAGRLNGRSVSPLNGSASKELNFLSPDSTYAKSPATPIMLSEVSIERRTLLLPSIQSREYYSEPSIDDLARWAKSDPSYLEAVPNFLVGRKGYGELRYKEPVDLRNVVIDKIVQFGDKEIRVYMDNGIEKPPPGEGLNKPAEITLFNVHKLEKGTGKVVKDPQKVETFRKKLQMRAQAQGAEFISYKQDVSTRNPKGGEYTFAVNHFSKYDGFVDDSDDETEVQAPQKPVYSDDRNLVQAMAIDSRLDPSEILMMQQEVIEVPERLPVVSKSASVIPSHSWKRSPSPLVEYKKKPMREVIRADLPDQEYSFSISKMVNYCQVETMPARQTCISGSTNFITDAAAILGRSFRVGWGPNGKFAHSGFWSMSSNQSKQNASSVHIEKVVSEQKRTAGSILNSPALQTSERAQKVCTKCLEIHMQHTLDSQPDGSEDMKCHFLSQVSAVPSRELNRKVLGVDDENIQSVCDSHATAMEVSADEDEVQSIHVRGIWSLMTSIFSQIDASSDDYNIIRRQKVSDWLKGHAAWAVGKELGAKDLSDLEKVILSLSKRGIQKATEQVLALKDPRLASLIAMAGCHGHMKEDISQQLEVWRSNSMDSLIQPDRLQIYELLSGNLENILPKFASDWRRALACIMWYEQSALDPVENSLQSFLAFHKAGFVNSPFPMYAEFGGSYSDRSDTAFELLKFLDSKHGPELRGILNTSGYTTDSLDYSLSWLILSVLEGLGVLNFDESNDEDKESMLHVHMGHILQLEYLGVDPEWMLYAALHVPNSEARPYLREDFVCQILNRTVSQWIDNQERIDFFTKKLGIPRKWISGARALWHKYRHQHELEFAAYMEAEAYPEAFTVFSETLGPDAFLREIDSVSHAFVPFSCVELRERVLALGERRGALRKAQQQELALYEMFVSMMESGSRGEVDDMCFDRLFDCFSAQVQPSTLMTAKFKAVVSKMCTIYAESVRYAGYDKGDDSRRASDHIKAACLQHLTPEEALAHIQDATSVLGGL